MVFESRVDVREWFEYGVCVEDERLTAVGESPADCEGTGPGGNGSGMLLPVGVVMGEFNTDTDECSGIEG